VGGRYPMLDRYKFAAELREFLLDREGMTIEAIAEDLVDLFVARCREMYAEKPTKK
jgi:hypothetical protein